MDFGRNESERASEMNSKPERLRYRKERQQIRRVVPLRILSFIAILGAGIFAIAETVQPFYRSDRALSDPYSSHVVGKYGFVQTIAFVALSAGSIALSVGLSRFGDATVRWRCGRSLLAIWSGGVLVAGIFPMTRAEGRRHRRRFMGWRQCWLSSRFSGQCSCSPKLLKETWNGAPLLLPRGFLRS